MGRPSKRAAEGGSEGELSEGCCERKGEEDEGEVEEGGDAALWLGGQGHAPDVDRCSQGKAGRKEGRASSTPDPRTTTLAPSSSQPVSQPILSFSSKTSKLDPVHGMLISFTSCTALWRFAILGHLHPPTRLFHRSQPTPTHHHILAAAHHGPLQVQRRAPLRFRPLLLPAFPALLSWLPSEREREN